MEAWLGGRFGQTAQRSRPLQDPAIRSGVGEADRSLASETIQWYVALLRIRFDERLEERTRLAREHDTLLQAIQGSKLVADHAQQHLHDPGITRTALQRLSQWLDRAVVEGRATLDSLRNSTRDTEDLASALRRACIHSGG